MASGNISMEKRLLQRHFKEQIHRHPNSESLHSSYASLYQSDQSLDIAKSAHLSSESLHVSQPELDHVARATDFGSSLVINIIPPDARDDDASETDTDASDIPAFKPPDGGWGWVVCVASFWTNGTVFGILNTFGILFVDILREFDDGQEQLAFKTSWVGSLQISVTFMLSPVASMLVDQLGIRPVAFTGGVLATAGMICSSFVTRLELLYLTHGLMLGTGCSLIYTPSMVILGHYFQVHLGIANGFVAAGSAVFTFGLPFLLKYLLAEVGLRHTMRVLAGFLAFLMLCSLTFKPLYHPRHHDTIQVTGKQESSCARQLHKVCNLSIWKNKGYVVWAIALPVAFLGYFVPFVHLTNHAKIVMPGSNAELLMTCIGATSGISRVICGKVADLPGVNRVRMQQFSFLIFGIATTCIPFANHYGILVSLVLLMGLCDGCFICLLGPIAFDLLGPAGAAQGLGCLLGLMSFPMTAGPPIAGLIYDQMQSYFIAFLVAGIPPLVGAIILFLMPYKYQMRALVRLAGSMISIHDEENDEKLNDQEMVEMNNKEPIAVKSPLAN